MQNEKEREISQDQAVALSARRAWLGRRAHRSAHIMCSRVLSLCAVLQSLRRSHASQVDSVRASKSAHARGAGGEGGRRERSMRLEIGTERGMHAELFFYIHLHASMGSAAAAGWSRQREDAAAQCESLCSAASTMSFLSMLLCDGRDSSVSSVATPVGASISWECAQHGDRFGGKLNSLQSRAGQQRSHPYGKAVLAARASLQCRALIHEVAAPPRAPVARARAQMLVIEGKAATEHCGSKHGCTPCACTPCTNSVLASATPIHSTLRGVAIFNKEWVRRRQVSF